ncbi:hypothetical protein DN069_04405 [Streptacidiphilus pinicola]|uniref:Uncharacterized protein n=1 Tax=Streptacidiphilus pinicola TaxID=2219663 RepID=A0A2X0J918_9ACTN|nr:hypothetical protein [Streptacidiphilus pinicola]RAG86786.1 hypothetical protein DN069_04405 [Streptacidiphilus pinicola]
MRSSAGSRPLALIAVLLMLAALVGLPATRSVADTPDPTINNSTVVIPEGIELTNQKERNDYAQKFVKDPRGEELVALTNALGYDVGSWRNIQVAWFSFGWMATSPDLPVWVRDNYQRFMYELKQEVRSPTTRPAWWYPRNAFMLDGENYWLDPLFKTLGEPATDGYGNDQVLSLTTGLANHEHSEDGMNEWVNRTLTEVLSQVARNPEQSAEIGKVISTIKSEAGSAIAGPRTLCLKCQKSVPANGFKFRQGYFLGVYENPDKPDTKSITRANLKSLITPLKNAYIQRVDSIADAGMQSLDLTAPCPDANANNPGGMDFAAAPASVSEPCDPSSSPLAKALSTPNYGGVDLTNLQLRYLSDDGGGVKYAFSSQAAEKGLTQDPDAAGAALAGSMEDLRTWLALSPDKFWVNLNPSEPDRIIDKDLGQTAAGRALLEADWHMKQTEGKLLDPNTSFGAAYWRALGVSGGQSCYSSRMWIVPGDVEVRQDGDSLYVLKATLDVKAKPEVVSGLGQTSCNQDPQQTARDAKVEQQMVVPEIQKQVNTAPEYAALRQAFLARVVAQWLLDRHAAGHATSFDKLIGSGDLGPAALHGSWRPQQVYDAYLTSIKNGTFTYHQTEHVGNATVTYVMRTGGVDFSKLNSTQLSGADMNREVPGLQQTIAGSTTSPATAADGSIWLGDTAKAPSVSAWDRASTYFLGRTGLAVLLGVALLALLFFVRDGSKLRRRSTRIPSS